VDIGEKGGDRGEGICLCGPSRPEQKRAKTAQIRMGAMAVMGKDLSPEVITRVVRNDNARLLSCYQQGLATNPQLEGRITAKLVIDAAGAIATNNAGGSDLPDANVLACVLSELTKLHFPARKPGSTTSVVLTLYLQPPPPAADR
jgi:hypothetical protein